MNGQRYRVAHFYRFALLRKAEHTLASDIRVHIASNFRIISLHTKAIGSTLLTSLHHSSLQFQPSWPFAFANHFLVRNARIFHNSGNVFHFYPFADIHFISVDVCAFFFLFVAFNLAPRHMTLTDKKDSGTARERKMRLKTKRKA